MNPELEPIRTFPMTITNIDMHTPTLGFGMPGGMEMVIFGLVILLLFGSAKLPKLMRDLGRSTNEFKAGMKETGDDETTTREEKA